MARIIDAFTQYFDTNGEPLVDGWIAFKESGSNADKDTFADNGQTIANANPVQLDASGRCPNVFGTGSYKVILYRDSVVTPGTPGEQIGTHDPVGGLGGTGFGSDWEAATTYSVPDVVQENGFYWQSKANGNLNNRPSEDAGTNWRRWPDGVDISDGSVTTDKLADQAVTESKLANDSVATIAMQDAAVTEEKISDSAVTENKLEEGTRSTLKSGRKNLIVNGLLSDPVNVRNAASIDAGVGYNFDRWYYDGTYLYYGIEEKDARAGAHVASWDSDATAEYQLVSTATSAAALPAGGWTTLPKGSPVTIGAVTGKHLWLKFTVGGDGFAALDRVQFESGTVATEFEYMHRRQRENLCGRYARLLRANVRFLATAGGQSGSSPASWPAMRAVPVESVIVGGISLNVGASYTLFNKTESGGRHDIVSIAAGDAYYLDYTLLLDAEL